jgi:hypothetical protein
MAVLDFEAGPVKEFLLEAPGSPLKLTAIGRSDTSTCTPDITESKINYIHRLKYA